MSFLWFTKSPRVAHDDNACFCDFCIFESYNAREGLAPYWYRGFKLREGQKITFVQVKKCMEVCNETSSRTTSTQNSADTSSVNHSSSFEGICRSFTFPKLLQEMIADEQSLEPDMNIANDTEFSSFIAKHLPGILWEHLGWTLVRQTRHPWNRF